MEPGKLHILHTNDIHSHFQQMPYIAGGIRELKSSLEASGDLVMVVDLGDHADRMSSLTEGTWGQANVEVMNATGYSLAAIGNNEGLTFPKEKFLSLYQQAEFQVLCGNLLDAETNEFPPFIKPYIIQQHGPLKIGWVSMTADFPVYRMMGWEVLRPLDELRNIVSTIRGQVDVIVYLSHAGYRSDQQLAIEIPGIDIIIGAHSHDLLERGVWVGQTFIIQTGKFGQYLGQTTIEYNPHTKKVISIEGLCHEVEQFSQDIEVKQIIERQQAKADEELSPAIAQLKEEFPISWEVESPLGNLLAEGIRDWVKTDIALVNSGQLLFSLPKGPVTRKDLLAVCPHPINPCKVMMKGRNIKEVLEESVTVKSIHRQIRGLGFRGKVLGWMCIDGMTLHYDLARPEGDRIVRMLVNGSPLLEEKTYSVGTVDMFTFGWIFPQFPKSEDTQYFLPEFIRDVLAKELKSPDALERSRVARWNHI